MLTDSWNLKVHQLLVAVLLSLSLFHPSTFHPVEAAPISNGASEGAVQYISAPPSSNISSYLDADVTTTPPDRSTHVQSPIDGLITVDEEIKAL